MRTRHRWTLILASAAALVTSAAPAQETTPSNPLLTRRGWEVGGQIAKYYYEEPAHPGFEGMNLKGNRVGAVGAYTFVSPSRVFNRIDGRVSYGTLEYTSGGTGTMDKVRDWITEVRAVIGKDFLAGDNVVLSPYIGLGYRYLFNDLQGYTTTGHGGYRRYSHYVYAPVGLAMRIGMGDRWVVAPTVEYDAFLGGRQHTKLTDVGPGYSDASNEQKNGRGYRAYLMVEKGHWAFGPWLHYWNIKDSDTQPVSTPLGPRVALEPANWTREYGVELRYRF